MPLSPTTPELGALDLFVSVVELGSLSKAAAAHGIAQPSASGRIRRLERQLGVPLLDRSPSGSSPTAEGSLVAGWAEIVIRSADQLMAGIEALRASEQGRLRVSASLTIAEYLLPPWLEQFLRNRPNDSIELEVTNSTHVLERLRNGSADLGFVESPTPTKDMEQHVVGTDRLITVVGKNHPWSDRDHVPIEALASTPLVLREQGSGTREAFEQFLTDAGYGRPICGLELGGSSRRDQRSVAYRHQRARGDRRHRRRQPPPCPRARSGHRARPTGGVADRRFATTARSGSHCDSAVGRSDQRLITSQARIPSILAITSTSSDAMTSNANMFSTT